MSIIGELFAIHTETWIDEAICPQTDAEEFYPEQGASAAVAKAVCRDCPVRIPCLQFALDNSESHGVWGGFTPKERMRLGRGQNPLKRGPAAAPFRANGHSIACRCFGCRRSA